MANVQHSSLTDPNIHEPKGITSAAANTLYMANGSSSGSWVAASRMAGTGYGRYQNTLYVGTTAFTVSSSDTALPFSPFTNLSTNVQLPIALNGSVWSLLDPTTGALRFETINDVLEVTLTFQVYSVTGSPTYVDLKMYGSSDGVTYSTLLGEVTVPLIKGAGQVITETSLFPVTTSAMTSYGSKIYAKTNTGSIDIINIGLVIARVHRAR